MPYLNRTDETQEAIGRESKTCLHNSYDIGHMIKTYGPNPTIFYVSHNFVLKLCLRHLDMNSGTGAICKISIYFVISFQQAWLSKRKRGANP